MSKTKKLSLKRTLPILAAPLIVSALNEKADAFTVQGTTGASAQQMFLGTVNTVYVVDKVENNSAQINGHPVYATEIDLRTNEFRALDIITNAFCAGGACLGNGTWINVGGNLPVGPGGVNSNSSVAPYEDTDGGPTIRLLDPCDTGSCTWTDNAARLLQRRWYPTCETIDDGSIIIIGGDQWGGFVNQASQTVPSYEFFPPKGTGTPPNLTVLVNTLPYNLYPLSWTLPSKRVLIQAGWSAAVLDYNSGVETALPDIPDAVRCYPASAATAMLPLFPSNNYSASVMFCGGLNIQTADATQPPAWFRQQKASTSCVSIEPDVSSNWVEEDPLPEGRVMGNFIYLPDGKLFLVNGVSSGAAGYNDSDVPYAIDAIMTPNIYDPRQPKGQKWSTANLGTLNFERLYHSSATLLASGCVYIAGSNPYVDVVLQGNTSMETYTQYTAETWCPDFFNKTRPPTTGIPTSFTYGGNPFDINLSASFSSNLTNSYVAIIRTGFSTHGINMGQRYLQLDHTYTRNADNSSVLHVSQLPPNSAIFPPGPALAFLVTDGVASSGVMVMIGNGQVGTQPVLSVTALPQSSGIASTNPPKTSGSGSGGNGGSGSGNGKGGNSSSGAISNMGGIVLGMMGMVLGGLMMV